MNKIEERFLDSFEKYCVIEPCFSVQDIDGEKVADCKITRVDEFFDLNVTSCRMEGMLKEQGFAILLDSQSQVGPYVVDFMLTLQHLVGVVLNLAIEIDGHSWHEKTKEQAANDKRRERQLLAAGYPVMRFTGSEVYTNANKCVQEVFSCAVSLVYSRIEEYRDHYEKEINEMDQIILGRKSA